MHSKKKNAFLLLIMLLSLIFYGCSNGTDDTRPSADEVALSASFQQEDGTGLCGSTVRFSFGGKRADYSLEDNGELNASGLPRSGEMSLTVLDRQEQVQGGMTLSLSEGAVIDATTDEGGVGHITLRKDTEEVKLLFVLKDDGSLLCFLRLT